MQSTLSIHPGTTLRLHHGPVMCPPTGTFLSSDLYFMPMGVSKWAWAYRVGNILGVCPDGSFAEPWFGRHEA